MPIEYKGLTIECGYRIDLLVENILVVELKSAEKLLPIHAAQLLTYMQLGKFKTGLLMNFNTMKLKDGLKRFVL
jgi:GxxExxY protein